MGLRSLGFDCLILVGVIIEEEELKENSMKYLSYNDDLSYLSPYNNKIIKKCYIK